MQQQKTVAALSAQIRQLRAENKRLRAALDIAEGIRDDLVSKADDIGLTIFGDYVPDANGNDRFSADGYEAEEGNPNDYSVAEFAGMDIEQARDVAGLLNQMLDVDWIDTDGSRQSIDAAEDEGEGVAAWAKEALGALEAAGATADLLGWLIRSRELVHSAPAALRAPTAGERLRRRGRWLGTPRHSAGTR